MNVIIIIIIYQRWKPDKVGKPNTKWLAQLDFHINVGDMKTTNVKHSKK